MKKQLIEFVLPEPLKRNLQHEDRISEPKPNLVEHTLTVGRVVGVKVWVPYPSGWGSHQWSSFDRGRSLGDADVGVRPDPDDPLWQAVVAAICKSHK